MIEDDLFHYGDLIFKYFLLVYLNFLVTYEVMNGSDCAWFAIGLGVDAGVYVAGVGVGARELKNLDMLFVFAVGLVS